MNCGLTTPVFIQLVKDTYVQTFNINSVIYC